MAPSSTDVFTYFPWLAPVDVWHPDAATLIEEARGLDWLIVEGEPHGLELWATLGGMTQADIRARTKAACSLSELSSFDESVAVWPVIARCLVELGSSDLPGKYLAAASLVDLMTSGRHRGVHQELLAEDWLEGKLDPWSDSGRRPYRKLLRRLARDEAGEPSQREMMISEYYWDFAEENERALSGVPSAGDSTHSFGPFLDGL